MVLETHNIAIAANNDAILLAVLLITDGIPIKYERMNFPLWLHVS